MPDPINLLVSSLSAMVFTIATRLIAKRYKSNGFYVLSLGFIYLMEILIMFNLFVYILSTSFFPFSYNESDTVKVFIDFFTIYQIAVIVYFKSADNIINRPYQEYLTLLKNIQTRFESEDWRGLEKLWVFYKEEKRNYFFNEFVEEDHEKTYTFLGEIISLKEINKHVNLDRNIYSCRMDEFKSHLNDQIHFYESHLNSKNSDWSGSIFLRFHDTPGNLYRDVKSLLKEKDLLSKEREILYKLVNTLKTYLFVIINVILLLTFIITYYYFKFEFFYY